VMTGGWWLWHCLKANTEDMGPIYQAGNQLSWGWIQGNFCPRVLFRVFQRPGDLFLWLSHPTIQKLWLSIRMILYSIILYLFLSLKNDMWKQKNENVNESTSAIIGIRLHLLVGGWALPLWKMMEFVSWDDDIPNMMGKIKFMFQTTNQI